MRDPPVVGGVAQAPTDLITAISASASPAVDDAGLERVYLLQPGLFQGTELLAMSEADWTAPGALSAAKRLMRQALAPHLGGRPLVSRELFLSAPRINLKDSPRD